MNQRDVSDPRLTPRAVITEALTGEWVTNDVTIGSATASHLAGVVLNALDDNRLSVGIIDRPGSSGLDHAGRGGAVEAERPQDQPEPRNTAALTTQDEAAQRLWDDVVTEHDYDPDTGDFGAWNHDMLRAACTQYLAAHPEHRRTTAAVDALHTRGPLADPLGVGYVIRRASGDLVGPFSTNGEAFHYVQPGDDIVHVNEHGNVIDYGPQFDEADRPAIDVEALRLTIAQRLAAGGTRADEDVALDNASDVLDVLREFGVIDGTVDHG